MHNGTIAAISTPIASGGIGVIRISGENAALIADKVFTAYSGKKIAEIDGYTALYGTAYDKEGIIDHIIALNFKAPHSYTGENVVELSCHGGVYIMRRLLGAVIESGARQAKAGEFTERAFLNGKMDLTAAESVIDMINAESRKELEAALSGQKGMLAHSIAKIRENLTSLAASLAAWADYPEDEVPEVSFWDLDSGISQSICGLQGLLDSFEQGKIIREGIPTAIAGKPNVGKSTLMNMLTRSSRSIVTEIPGTTRDIVEETVMLGEIKLILADTAGLHSSTDEVEKIGIEMAADKISSSSLVLAVFDSSRPLDEEDERVISITSGLPCVAVINKCDLERTADIERLKTIYPHTVFISAVGGEGKDELCRAVAQVCGMDKIEPDSAIVANERQRSLISEALCALREADEALQSGLTFDAVGILIDDAISSLLSLSGEKVSDHVINEVFSRFCVGK